jgi:molybdopterin/thiamine biosynthesis adenylyltransferase
VADVGRPKAQSARESINAINPLIDVRLREVRLEASNAVALFEQYDLIVDGTDNFATRYLSTTPRSWLESRMCGGRLTGFRARCQCSGRGRS